MSPELKEACVNDAPAAWYTPFLYHEIDGELPPLVMLAVKDTAQVLYTVVEVVALIEMVGVTGADTAKGG
jgi:hypothetical protein